MEVRAYSTLHEPAPPEFAADGAEAECLFDGAGSIRPALAQHLTAMAQQVATQLAVWPRRRYLIDRHLHHTKWRYVVTVEPGDDHRQQLADWAWRANCILALPDGDVTDPGLWSLLHPDSADEAERDAHPPYTGNAVERAVAVRARFRDEYGVEVPVDVPPARGADEVRPQAPPQVAVRTLALLMTAELAAAVTAGQPSPAPERPLEYPQAFAARSPQERALFMHRDPALAAALTGRLAAAETLLWATGGIDRLDPAAAASNDALAIAAYSDGEQAFIDGTVLRPLPELLDQQERQRCLLWAVRHHQHANGPALPDVDPDVALHRLAALNWLLDWRASHLDDIDTAT